MHVQINPITRIKYNGLYHNADDRSILVYISLIVEQTGLPLAATSQPPMRVDDTTAIPVHKPAGTPLMRQESRPTGQTDENGIPVLETVQVPVTISEYDMLTWMCFDRRNPSPVAIETILEEGMKRRLGISQAPYVFVRTAAWEAAHP